MKAYVFKIRRDMPLLRLALLSAAGLAGMADPRVSDAPK